MDPEYNEEDKDLDDLSVFSDDSVLSVGSDAGDKKIKHLILTLEHCWVLSPNTKGLMLICLWPLDKCRRKGHKAGMKRS